MTEVLMLKYIWGYLGIRMLNNLLFFMLIADT
jgi:hypothetical protein